MKQLLAFILSVISNFSFSQTTQVTFKVFSEGFYRNATNTMVAVIDPVLHPMICDTVLFAFIDPLTNNSVYCTRVVVGTDGYGNLDVPLSLSGQMLIPYVRFRNTLGIYSRNEILIEPDSNNFDLTEINFATPNCNQDYNVAKAYSGEMNQDGFIDVDDFILYDIDNLAGAFGYLITDLNGDGFVDAIDFPLFDNNNAAGVSDPYWFTCASTNISDLNIGNQSFLIYPNPASTSFVIESHLYNDDFLIYNTNGRVEEYITNSNRKKIFVDISNLKAGIYLLKSTSTKRTTYILIQ